MKKAVLLLSIFIASCYAFNVSTGWKVLNPNEVVVNFKLNEDDVKGTIKGVDAEIDFNPTDFSKSTIKTVVKVNNLTTFDSKRDEHLMSADFFEEKKYPTIQFVSKSISKAENGFVAKGKLTMKDKSHDVSVPFRFEENKAGEAIFKGEMTVMPNKFGVISDKKSKETVSISVEIPLMK